MASVFKAALIQQLQVMAQTQVETQLLELHICPFERPDLQALGDYKALAAAGLPRLPRAALRHAA